MKSLYYIFISTVLLLGCSEAKKNSNQRIINNLKWTRQYLSARNRNDFILLIEQNKNCNNNNSIFNNIQIKKVREKNIKYSQLLGKLAVKSDSFELQLSFTQDKYKEEILKNLNVRTRRNLSEIPYENVLTGEKIKTQTATENTLVKEAILNEIEMNNFVIPNLILRQWGEILTYCE